VDRAFSLKEGVREKDDVLGNVGDLEFIGGDWTESITVNCIVRARLVNFSDDLVANSEFVSRAEAGSELSAKRYGAPSR
jgi:hypothetical protein